MRAILTMGLLALLAVGCNDLEEFQTDEGEVYRGMVVGTGPDDCERPPCSFVRRGVPASTTLDMVFVPALATSPVQGLDSLPVPGHLTTDDDALCGGRTFDRTPLYPIGPLQHDQLGLYEFPGVGRIKNYIFHAEPASGPFEGRDVTVFVSLLRGGRVELRALAGSGRECVRDRADCSDFDPSQCDLFALFVLEKTRTP